MTSALAEILRLMDANVGEPSGDPVSDGDRRGGWPVSESSADADEQLPVSPATRLKLHPLRRRADGADSVVIGRVETGDFVAVPPIAVKVIELLGRGLSVADVQARMRTETGSDVDVAEFAADLIELGFVA